MSTDLRNLAIPNMPENLGVIVARSGGGGAGRARVPSSESHPSLGRPGSAVGLPGACTDIRPVRTAVGRRLKPVRISAPSV